MSRKTENVVCRASSCNSIFVNFAGRVFQQPPKLITTIIARTRTSHAAKTLHVAEVCLDRRNCMVAKVGRVAVEYKSLVLPL
jgi:hypothetical protein